MSQVWPVKPRADRVTLVAVTDSRGGLWRNVTDLACGLRRIGWDVDLGLLPGSDSLRSAARDLNLPVRPLLSFNSQRRIVHFHIGNTYDRALLPMLVRTRLSRDTRSVITEHLPRTSASDRGLATRRPRLFARTLKSILKRTQYSLVDLVIAVSTGSEEFLRSQYPNVERKLRLVNNGILLGAQPVVSPSLPCERFVAIGSVIFQKGYDVLIDAAAQAQEKWTVDVVGAGVHMETLAARASRTSGLGRVNFIGWRDNPSDELANCLGLVMPSRWEAFPYAPLEAMDAGRAVVASAVDGLDQIVEDGLTGFLTPAGDASQLALALDRLVRDQRRAVQMGQNGNRRVRDLYGVDKMVAETVEAYGSLQGIER